MTIITNYIVRFNLTRYVETSLEVISFARLHYYYLSNLVSLIALSYLSCCYFISVSSLPRSSYGTNFIYPTLTRRRSIPTSLLSLISNNDVPIDTFS